MDIILILKGLLQKRHHHIKFNFPTINWGSVILPLILCYELTKGTPLQNTRNQKLQYTIPLQSEIKLNLLRPSDALLYGLSKDSRGVKICEDDTITIEPSSRTAKVIKIKS